MGTGFEPREYSGRPQNKTVFVVQEVKEKRIEKQGLNEVTKKSQPREYLPKIERVEKETAKIPKQKSRVLSIEDLSLEKQEEVKDLANTQAIQYLHLLRHFGIDSHPTADETKKLKTIWNFVDGKSTAEVISSIIRLRNKLGSPRVGESPLEKVYRHVQLRMIKNEKV